MNTSYSPLPPAPCQGRSNVGAAETLVDPPARPPAHTPQNGSPSSSPDPSPLSKCRRRRPRESQSEASHWFLRTYGSPDEPLRGEGARKMASRAHEGRDTGISFLVK